MHRTSRYVVTGGGGFVGRAIIDRLLREGHDVVSISRGSYPELTKRGVRTIQADIGREFEKVANACSGASGVFHTAAKVGLWGAYRAFYETNVVGTQNIIKACREAKVRALVYTSSPSVIADGTNLEGIDESYPYPKRFDASYPKTKAIAEQEILRAHSESLRTTALRPHLIFGPGDTNLVPLILKRAASGRLVRIGSGKNLVDFSYIDDCVEAHLLAMQELEGEGRSAGKAYFISQGRPVPLWKWIDQLLAAHGYEPVSKHISTGTAIAIGSVLEILARIFPIDPPITRFLAHEMSTHHYFNIDAARRDFGYVPRSGDPISLIAALGRGAGATTGSQAVNASPGK